MSSSSASPSSSPSPSHSPQLQKLLTLHKSGRFECDQYFHTALHALCIQLSLFQHMLALQKNKALSQKISTLTRQHLQSLQQQDNEQKALSIIHQLNSTVKQIETGFISPLLQQILLLNGKSYLNRLVSFTKKQPYKKIYLQVLDRILNTVHDEELKFYDMMLVGIFMNKNGEKLANFVTIYGNVIENGVSQLKKFRERWGFIRANREIEGEKRVRDYVKGSAIMLGVLLKFNEVYKILSGDSRFGLKLNALRGDVFVEGQAKEKEKQAKDGKEDKSKNVVIKQFKEYLLNGKEMSNYCSLCLCAGEDHQECRNTIKLLYQKKQ